MMPDLTPLFYILGLMVLGGAFVFLGGSLYGRYKEAKWLASFEESDASPPTEAEKAIGDEWRECGMEAKSPGYETCRRAHGHDGPCAHEPAGEAPPDDEMKAVEAFAQPCPTQKSERESIRIQPEPTHMTYEGILAQVEAAAKTPKPIPVPTDRDMVGVMFQKSVEHEQYFGNAVGMLGVDESEPCVICFKREDHYHTGADVRVYIEREARLSLEAHVERMDLTQLSNEALDKLFIRCKARIEWMANLDAMKRLDDVYDKVTTQMVDEDLAKEADEAFYRKTVENPTFTIEAKPVKPAKKSKKPAKKSRKRR